MLSAFKFFNAKTPRRKDAKNYRGGCDASSQWGGRGAPAARLPHTRQFVVLGGGDEGGAATPARRSIATTFAPPARASAELR
jgi:hypothetical protein